MEAEIWGDAATGQGTPGATKKLSRLRWLSAWKLQREDGSTHTCISDFQPPELEEKDLVLF